MHLRAPSCCSLVVAAAACAGSATSGPTTPGAAASPGAAGPRVPAGVFLDTRTKYYAVTGDTPEALARSMRALGPREDGVPRQGLHHGYLEWHYRTAARAAGCEVADVSVRVTSEMTLPRWDGLAQADTALAADWRRFVAALEAHELQHRALDLEYAGAIVRAARNVRGDRCDDVGAGVRAEAESLMSRLPVAQKELDRSTAHGARTGVVWPPRRAAAPSARP